MSQESVPEHRLKAPIEIEYVPSKEFEAENAAEVILGPPPRREEKPTRKPPAGLPPYLASLYSIPLL